VIDSVRGFVESVLTFLHDLLLPIFGANSWGWAIIALTLIVRIALLPLAIKQTRSMRAMQAIQPQMKALQKKYKVDKELMRKDPEKYKAKKAKLNEEMMALYKEEGANPAASCLPLLAQAPVFIALFWTLRDFDTLSEEGFYFFLNATDPAQLDGLRTAVSAAGWPGWLLIVLMSGTMFLSQKQMMARTAATGADNPMAQQQKILLYVMPIFLAVISFQFPIGILLYWVTTNFWQVVQQAIILREVQHEVETGELENKPGGGAAKKTRFGRKSPEEAPNDEQPPRPISPGASSGKRPSGDGSSSVTPPSSDDDTADDTAGDAAEVERDDTATKGVSGSTPSSNGAHAEKNTPDEVGKTDDPEPSAANTSKRDHLPRRGGSAKG
jgi:YidC/Oxa1 family membrane protein insertase